MLKEILIRSVYAAASENYLNKNYNTGTYKDLTLENALKLAANVIIYVGWGLVLIFLAMGFIQFVTAGGDKAATEKAQKWVTYSIIGGVGLLLVYAIRNIISSFTGVTI